MKQYISKDALVAEIERRIKTNKECMLGLRNLDYYQGKVDALNDTISFLDTLEVKEVGISIPNIDDTLKEEGLDPDSKEAKVFKESYYMALENLKRGKEKSYE